MEKEKFTTFYVKCSKCSEKKFTNKDAYEKRLAKYGTLEKMESEWICSKCSKNN